jgi:two-component system, chemotaxis family, CheB/CheR fusion protein
MWISVYINPIPLNGGSTAVCRMVLNRMDGLKSYVELLTHNPNEVKALYADILINVTGFFRDPDAFEALSAEVFPQLMENRAPGVPIRIWVPGCSTGEEVYSIAISLLEFLGEKVSHTPIQIFATDISEHAIQKARLAEYPENISGNVSGERLSRFFSKLDGAGYKVAKSIRDICVFSRHDVTSDPPFARIDLISCRNLLIYFKPTLQKHVVPIFHYSLTSRGYLWLGKSETIGGSSDLFALIDKANKVYVRKEAPIALNLRFPSSTYVHGSQDIVQEPRPFAKVGLDVLKISDQTIQSEYPGVLVNESMEILHVRGRTAPFVELVSGVPSFNLLKMAHPELVRELRTAIRETEKSKSSVKREDLSIGEGRNLKTFNLKVIPIKHPQNSKERLFLILFEKNLASNRRANR